MAQAHLDDERAKLSSFDDELLSLEDASRSKTQRITEDGLEIQRLSHQIEKSQKDANSSASLLREMEKEHPWILEAKDSFAKPNTPYDFTNRNIPECKSQLRTVTERFQNMKKKINPKVMNMIDSVEKKEASLKNMMKTVIRDKRKIEETIVSLDEYKKTALERTWKKVDAEFGEVFRELLPGSFAKLEPPEGKTVSEGLEVKVCLGKVWKQSLTELSGGQRCVPLVIYLRPKAYPERANADQLSDPSSPSPLSSPSCKSNRHPCTSSTKWTRPSISATRRILAA